MEKWGVGTFFWVIIVVISKVIVSTILYANEFWWTRAGKIILTPVAFNSKVELVTAMLVAPFICMMVSFWVIDSFLKSGDWKSLDGGYARVAAADLDLEDEDQGYPPESPSASVL